MASIGGSGQQAVRTAIQQGAYILAEAGIDSPSVEARLLLEHVFDVDNLVYAPQTLNSVQQLQYLQLIGQRATRRPLQHITGKMYFRRLELESREDVFIVRPETEMVVQAGIEATRLAFKQYGSALVVDLCTGSGAIALAVATEVPGTRVSAVDISAEACSLARANVRRICVPHNLEIVDFADWAAEVIPPEILEQDATCPQTLADLDGKVDVVISNPPYVPLGDVTQLEAQSDPDLALYGEGDKGLDIPQKILARAAVLLRPGGKVVMEHAEKQAETLRNIATVLGLVEVHTGKDLAGNQRWVEATKPQNYV